jgi:hypothetical protein
MNPRKVIPLGEGFFNDGYWYVLSSTSLGGSGLTAAEIADRLEVERADHKEQLLRDGICLPLYFDGDCAMDRAVIVIGDLSEQEASEWVGRLRSTLEIPCGELMIMGGGDEESFEEALASFEPEDPEDTRFQKVKVDKGRYLVEVYAFVGSMTVDEHWGADYSAPEEEQLTRARSIAAWWDASRPGEPQPQWLERLLEEGYVDSEELGLLEYIIRLVPCTEEVPLPALHEDTKWCGVFELREPPKAPLGIPRQELGS